MQRLHALLICTVVCLACDPHGDDPETLALADDIEEPGLAAAPERDEPTAPDADVPLGADVKPQADTPVCKTYSKNTNTDSLAQGCKGAGPSVPPLFEIGLEEIGHATAMSQCSSAGNTIAPNGKTACRNACESQGKNWTQVIDGGICLVDAEITASPVQWQAAPAAVCPGGYGKYTGSVHAEAECGCTCSP